MKFANDYGLDTSRFVPFVPLFQEIVKDHPAHQLGGRHPNAGSKFLNHHGVELHAAGVVVRLQSGTWLADPARLPAAVLLLKTGGTLEPLPLPARPAPLANLIGNSGPPLDADKTPNATRRHPAKPRVHKAKPKAKPIRKRSAGRLAAAAD
jgi:hypothetical protein